MDSLSVVAAKRLVPGLLTLIVIYLLTLLGVEVILGQQAMPETVEAFRRELKLDLPHNVRYFS
jgi:peptide/nickel transport system permease protein